MNVPDSLDSKTSASLKVRASLTKALEGQRADSLLLSGGIDSSTLASLDANISLITVGLQGNRSTDFEFAAKVASRTGSPWYKVEVTTQEALAAVQVAMKLSRSYDRGIFNTAVDYLGMRYSASLGLRTVRTGDFADELYRGYSFLYDKEDPQFRNELLDLYPHVKLPASVIAERLGLKIDLPYLNPIVLDTAFLLAYSDNIKSVRTSQAGDIYESLYNPNTEVNTWSKIALRQASLGTLPLSIVFRQKTHMEFGSGFYTLDKEVAKLVDDEEINQFSEQGVALYDKAHAGLYKLFKQAGLSPDQPTEGQYACAWCSGGVNKGSGHCRICGGFPANEKPAFLSDTKNQLKNEN